MSTNRARRRIAAATVLVVLGLLGTATPASAWTRFYSTVDGLALRTGPSTSYAVIQRVGAWTPLDADCAVVGEYIDGDAVWLRLTGGQYVTDRYTNSDGWGTRFPTGVPGCGAVSRAEAAARAAEARVGQVYTSENPNAGYWSGWCETFVEVAYGRIFRYASAKDHWYAARYRLQYGTPPRGAVVFYLMNTTYGHVAISVGGGMVVSTQGYTYNRYPVARLSATYFGTNSGWYLP